MTPSNFTTDALVQSVFRDDYGLETAKLEALYSKSKRHQWNAESDVDWKRFDPGARILARESDFLGRLRAVNELPEPQQDALFRAAALFTLSQVLHGEQAALMVCGQLVNVVPDVDGKFAAAVQVMDEARHVEVFARYLDCHGRRYPIDPDLQRIVERILSEPDWEAKCVGMQVILESVALGFFRVGQQMAVEPLLADFIGRVHEDEARHVAYGVLTLEERVPQLGREARTRLEELAYDAVARIGGRAGRPSFTSQFAALAEAGVDVASFLPKILAELSSPEGLDVEGVSDPISDTVLPNLVRVGLVPDHHLEGYLAQGWRIDRETGAVRDLHVWHGDARAAREGLRDRGVDFADPAQLAAA